jgi:hypothetical protein
VKNISNMCFLHSCFTMPCITCIVPINNYFFNSCFTWEAYMNWWKMITYATITKLIYTSNACVWKKINLCWKWTNSNCVPAISKETWKINIFQNPNSLTMKKLQIESYCSIQSITNVGIIHYPNVFGEGNILTQN